MTARIITAILLLAWLPTAAQEHQKLQTHQSKIDTGMNTQDFTTTILVNASASETFHAITNFRAWWSEEIEGATDKPGETFFYHYKDVHLSRIKLVEMVPGKKLVYEVIENRFNFVKDPTEWVGTKLLFELTPEGGKTKVRFTHQGLVPEYECYEVCHDAWTSYIKGSLKDYIETGVGRPNAKEGGLNAELVEKWGLPDTPSTDANSVDSFTMSIVVDKSPEEVFKAINNPRAWWQGEYTGPTEKVGDEFSYEVTGVHFSKQKVVEQLPNEKVVWLVTDSNLTFVEDKHEWTNTKIIFTITPEGSRTKLTFTHEGLVPAFECYHDCSMAWTALVGKSLFSFITTGKGVKVF